MSNIRELYDELRAAADLLARYVPPYQAKRVNKALHAIAVFEHKNFADYPKSVTEIRSDKSSKGTDWTPRDALIDVLRDIDAGIENPTELVIALCTVFEETGQQLIDFRCAAKSSSSALGLLTRVSYKINKAIEG